MDTPAERISRIIADFAKMGAKDLAMVYQDTLAKGLAADAPALFDYYNKLAKTIDAIGTVRFLPVEWSNAKTDAEIPF